MKKHLFFAFFFFFAFQSFSQSVLIPYRNGKLWGLADTNGVVKVAPAYDNIEVENVKKAGSKTITPFYLVKKNGKYGLMDGTKLLLPPKAERIFLDSVFVREFRSVDGQPIVGSSREVVRNLSGTVLFKDTVREVKAVEQQKGAKHLLYYTSGVANNSGIFWYDPQKQEIVQWLIKDAYFISVRADRQNNLFAFVMKTATEKPYKKYQLVFNKSTNLYEAKLSNAPNNFQDDERQRGSYSSSREVGNNVAREAKFVKNKSGDIVRIVKESRYRENGSKTDSVTIKLDADSLSISDFSAGNYSSYHSMNIDFVGKTDTVFSYQNYVTYTKNGKKGMVVEKNVVPAIYNDLIYFYGSMVKKPMFMASKLDPQTGKLRWGVIGSDGKEIQPCIYDQIIRGKGGSIRWILKKDNLYGLTDINWKIKIPVKYEKIIASENFLSFSIFDKGKYGYVGFYDEMILPTFPYPVSRKLSFGGYPIFELKDTKDKVLGYANTKGLLFFKN